MARKILIVDDEPLIVKGLKYSLEQDGYETDSAVDGEEAVNKDVYKRQVRTYARRSGKSEKPGRSEMKQRCRGKGTSAAAGFIPLNLCVKDSFCEKIRPVFRNRRRDMPTYAEQRAKQLLLLTRDVLKELPGVCAEFIQACLLYTSRCV